MPAKRQPKPQWTLDDLLPMSTEQLEGLMTSGLPVAPRDLEGLEFNGTSLGLPRVVETLTWKKFKKVFYRDPLTGVLRGWNVRCKQNELNEPWLSVQFGDGPLTYGHYQVVDSDGKGTFGEPPGALIIHYGKGDNLPLDMTGLLRDPIVALNPGSVDLLLGRSYLDLGLTTQTTPSFFALQPGAPLSHVSDPPKNIFDALGLG